MDKEIRTAAQVENVTAKAIMDALPGLMGALDHAVKDLTKTELPMMLVLFLPDGAMYITNTDTNAAREAVRSMVQGWDQPGTATTAH